MLPAANRMRSSTEFRYAVAGGSRASRRTVVVHVHPVEAPSDAVSRVGFVVSKKVGNAVVRNRVKRQLRHLSRPMVTELERPTMIVVRALPAAAEHPERLSSDLRAAWTQAMSRL